MVINSDEVGAFHRHDTYDPISSWTWNTLLTFHCAARRSNK